MSSARLSGEPEALVSSADHGCPVTAPLAVNSEPALDPPLLPRTEWRAKRRLELEQQYREDTLVAAAQADALSILPKFKHLPRNSKVRKTVKLILAMQIEGMTKAEIAQALHLTERTVGSYLYLAGKNGWLPSKHLDPRDKLDYVLMDKVVRNLQHGLDSPDPDRADAIALKVAEGTIFKQYDQVAAVQPQTNVLAIRVELPQHTQDTIREGAAGGKPRYVTGEVLDGQ